MFDIENDGAPGGTAVIMAASPGELAGRFHPVAVILLAIPCARGHFP